MEKDNGSSWARVSASFLRYNVPMNDAQNNSLIWISRPAALDRMMTELENCRILAVDTESNSLYAYYEKVCLIQVSNGEKHYLVDSLALKDLSPLGAMFSNPEVETIFHAAEYDLIGLKRDFGFTFANLFDTMHAGRILGRKALGLASMLEIEFNIKLDKRFQRANWGRRPIPPEMQHYASMDVIYLIPLRKRLREALIAADRLQLAEEDFARLCDVSITTPPNQSEQCWRLAGGKHLGAQQLTVLMELCRYRDQAARSANLPPFKILGKQAMLDIAISQPTSVSDLKTTKALSQKQTERHGKALVEAVRRSLKQQPVKRPHGSHTDEQVANRIDALRNWRKQAARTMGVESDVIMPRYLIEDIANANPHNREDLADLLQSTPWRLQRFDGQILQVLSPWR